MQLRRASSAALAGLCMASLTATAVPAHVLALSRGGVDAGPLHWDPTNPATRTYYIPTVAPGGTFTDSIRVQNPNRDTVDLYVDAVDGITAAPSGAVYANRTDPVRKWGAWVTPAVSALSLQAGAETLVPFTVRVPADATPGDHLAGVAFENSYPSSGSGPVEITSIIRTVVGVLIEVPGLASFQLALGAPSIQPLGAQGYASVVVPVTDIGGRLGKPLLTVTLDGPSGYHHTLSHQLDTILPGDTIAFPFPWPDRLLAGAYTITVVATGTDMQTVTAAATFTLGRPLPGVPSPARAPIAPAAGSTLDLPLWVTFAAITVIALLLALVGLLIVWLLIRRREKDNTADPAHLPAPRHAAAAGSRRRG